MKENNEYFDNKIRELADYKPEVEPEWEAFYAKNQQGIEGLKTGAGKTSPAKFVASSGLKYTLIAISVVAIFIAGYYFSSDNSNQNNSIEKSHETRINKQNEVIIPAEPVQENLNKTPEINEVVNIETDNSRIFDAKNQKSEVPATIIDEKINAPLSDSDSISDKPVIIKKTIIIQDTIMVKRPVGK